MDSFVAQYMYVARMEESRLAGVGALSTNASDSGRIVVPITLNVCMYFTDLQTIQLQELGIRHEKSLHIALGHRLLRLLQQLRLLWRGLPLPGGTGVGRKGDVGVERGEQARLRGPHGGTCLADQRYLAGGGAEVVCFR